MSIAVAPRAAHDIDAIADYLEVERAGSGNRFQNDLMHALARLERLPESAPLFDPPCPLFPNLREAQLKKFGRYVVYYQPTADGIRVERVLHASHDVAAIFRPDDAPPGS